MLSPLLILEIPWKAGCFIDDLAESEGKARLRERAPEFNANFEFKLISGVVALSGKVSAARGWTCFDDVSFSRFSCPSVRFSIGIGTDKTAGQTDKGKVGIICRYPFMLQVSGGGGGNKDCNWEELS